MTNENRVNRSHPDETLMRGTAGASARAEYARRHQRDALRRRARFGRLTGLVDLLVGPKATTEAWARGAEGEERVGRRLDEEVGAPGAGVVLHDRRVRGRRLNLDHVVVNEWGVWVIDTKHYRGRLARRRTGGWFVPRDTLTVGRRNETRLVTGAQRQRTLVADAVGADVPVHAVLCFTGVERAVFARPFVIDGVLVTWPAVLVRSLTAPGASSRTLSASRTSTNSIGASEPSQRRATPLTIDAQHELAARIARIFPPYVRATSAP